MGYTRLNIAGKLSPRFAFDARDDSRENDVGAVADRLYFIGKGRQLRFL